MTKEERLSLTAQMTAIDNEVKELTERKLLLDKQSDKLRRAIKVKLDEYNTVAQKRWPKKPVHA